MTKRCVTFKEDRGVISLSIYHLSKIEEISIVVNNTRRLSLKIPSFDSIMTNQLSSFLDK